QVDLAGFTLTDDLGRPDKFTVPEGIAVPPRGFLLVWADENTSQTRTNGDLHVNFKLAQDGEQIALYDPAGRQLDAVLFGPQTNDVSQGRWPDGAAAPFYFMNTPTPRAPNVFPASRPIVQSLAISSGNAVNLIWTAQPGQSYRVQYKTALDETTWIDLPGE